MKEKTSSLIRCFCFSGFVKPWALPKGLLGSIFYFFLKVS